MTLPPPSPRPSLQAPGAVVMVRPARFRPNPQTSADNAFQSEDPAARGPDELAWTARLEVIQAADTLRREGVRVHVFDELPEHDTPDAVFPNNWFSTHADGRIALYPMCAANRRKERRDDVIDMLRGDYAVSEVVDFSFLEHDGVFLEGTGAMVLDHDHRAAYVARSGRADERALAMFCGRMGYEPVAFNARDGLGRAIYHTNVMMSLASEFALVGLELVPDAGARRRLEARLAASEREVVALTAAQVGEFAGNALELSTPGGRVLAMSVRAAESLQPGQRHQIERSARIVALPVPTIELAGGSVRCMLAGIHLAPRPDSKSKREGETGQEASAGSQAWRQLA